MQEVVGAFTGEEIDVTFFWGTKPIDGVWATSDIVVTGACVIPAGYGVGDHQMFIVDFLTSSLVGNSPPRIAYAGTRRLNTNIHGATSRYAADVEEQVLRHKVMQQYSQAHESSPEKQAAKREYVKIDRESKQYMLGADTRYRKIKSGRIPFLLESSKRIRRCQVYRSILRYHAGNIRNHNNLKRSAKRCGISSPLSLSLSEVRVQLKVCKERCNYFKKNGHQYR